MQKRTRIICKPKDSSISLYVWIYGMFRLLALHHPTKGESCVKISANTTQGGKIPAHLPAPGPVKDTYMYIISSNNAGLKKDYYQIF